MSPKLNYTASLGCRQDIHLLAILGDCPPSDRNAFIAQFGGELAVTDRLQRGFGFYHLADPGLRCPGRGLRSGGRPETCREEVLHGEQPMRSEQVFVVHGT